MCRVFGAVAREPISVRHSLLEAENPLIHQSADHDSGWGMAVYKRADGEEPNCVRFPDPAYQDGAFESATEMRGRIFNIHVRRATMGGEKNERAHTNEESAANASTQKAHEKKKDGSAKRKGQQMIEMENLRYFM